MLGPTSALLKKLDLLRLFVSLNFFQASRFSVNTPMSGSLRGSNSTRGAEGVSPLPVKLAILRMWKICREGLIATEYIGVRKSEQAPGLRGSMRALCYDL
jgi:hypothetical protein